MSEEENYSNAHEKTAKSAARARAEARRRRILEASNTRMSVVSGEVPKEVPKEELTDNAVTTETTPEEGGAGEDGADTQETPTEESSAPAKSSAGARYAQMRRRRYKKSNAATTTTTATTEATETATTTEEGTTTAVSETKTEAKEEKTAETNEEEEDNDANDNDDGEEGEAETEGTTTKKKYMGVARMRRKRLHEQKMKEEANEESKSTKKKILPKSLSTIARTSTPKSPIIFQLLTVLLLFFVGLDIGVHHSSSWDGAKYPLAIGRVELELSPVQHGIGAARLIPGTSGSSSSTSSGRDALLNELQNDAAELDGGDDEFADVGSANGGGEYKEPVIDPIFQMDLDLYTSGPGVIMFMARKAVSAHRFITWLFYLLPMSIIMTIVSLPKSLVTNPPIMFLVVVILRFVSRHIFGAQIPDLDAMGSPTSGEDDKDAGGKGKDIMSMVTGAVKDQFMNAFPGLVMAWTMFNDARTDIYVVLCGLFVGLTLPSNFFSLISGGDKDEL
mmetsp:Transcript_5448/g.8064  ORF Transcript_5448/g.8064 Transcript_5448/m.8064 type:complete len:505 (-) Transcript_5448:270-1784(-)